MIDEQLDTLGQAFLGLTIGCARCHDHKFDPIPTKDYYALAGILHSTDVADLDLYTEEDALRKQAADKTVKELQSSIESIRKDMEGELGKADLISRQAEKFDRGNVVVDDSNYGKGIGIISDPGGQDNFAEYDFDLKEDQSYLLQLRYSAKTPRPGRILVNGKVAVRKAISKATGSWMPDTQTWFFEGVIDFKKGKNTLRIESSPLMSHIDQFRLIKASKEGMIRKQLVKIAQLEQLILLIQEGAPAPRKVMAVKDGNAKDIPVHLRGSHLSLGDKVPRGFLSTFKSSGTHSVQPNASGRLQLAKWLTDSKSQASHRLARVIVNRIWHWYFGRGLVDSPNEFGIRGDQPSHPELLDYLATRLIKSGWSIKSIHREILLSSTYRMASRPRSDSYREFDPDNRLLSFHPVKRMTPEIFRDSILGLRGTVDLSMGGKPPTVTSQNPSPEQMDQNQKIYDSSRRRSVFLPIVRSNTYDLLTNFDFPDASATAGKRTETIVPTQSLLLMNGAFVRSSSFEIYERLKRMNRLAPQEIYRALFHRNPSQEQILVLAKFLGKSPSRDDYALLIHSLLLSNEFIYVD